jgi:hypothetical protein
MLKFFANINGTNEGPFTLEELKDLSSKKKITPKTIVTIEGTEEWVAAKAIEGLFPSGIKKPKASSLPPFEPIPPIQETLRDLPTRAPLQQNEQSGWQLRLDIIINKIMGFVFKIGKIVSAIFILLCALTIAILGLIYFFSGSGGVETPDFNELLEEQRDNSTSEKQSYSNLEDRREVEKKYGDKIQDIVKKNDLSEQAYDVFINKILSIPKKLRAQYVSGLEDFLSDAKKHIQKEGSNAKVSVIDAANIYNDLFEQAIANVKISKAEAAALKSTMLIGIGITFGAFILFLIIPVLLQIEINTRNKIKNLAN